MTSNQTAKFVNSKEKDGTTKVLALSGFFGGTDRSNGKLEHSNLHRFAVEGHFVQRKDSSGKDLPYDKYIKKEFHGNLPIEAVPSLLYLSKKALDDKLFNDGNSGKITLLAPEWKPMMRDKFRDAEGNPLVYCIEINYLGNLGLPIQIKITNGHAPVVTAEGGKMNIKLSALKDKEEMTIYSTTTEWYNKISNCWDSWLLYRQRLNQQGYFDEEFLLKMGE